MKKSTKIILTILVIAIVGFIAYSYFYVDGTELKEVSRISHTTKVVIKRSTLRENEEELEVVLNSNQKEMLKSLLKESRFRRMISSGVIYDSEENWKYYNIIINDHEQGVYLSIHSTDGAYISIPDKFNGKHLKILNPQWKNKLEEIITLSD